MKQNQKNMQEGKPRNGAYSVEEMIRFGLTRPMRRTVGRTNLFVQDMRIMSLAAKELGVPLTIAWHYAAEALMREVNAAHVAAGREGLAIVPAMYQEESDYLPEKGVYKNWRAKYAEVEQRMRAEGAGGPGGRAPEQGNDQSVLGEGGGTEVAGNRPGSPEQPA